jgi:hypothetical protein
MPASRAQARHVGQSYSDRTHRPLTCLLLVLPPMAFYHICSIATGSLRRAGANVHMLDLMGFFGIGRAVLAPLLIIAVLLAMHLLRRDPWKIDLPALAGMVLEGIAWTVPIIAVNLLRGQFASASAGNGQHVAGQAQPGLAYLCADVGAAVYEEFVFRLVLISLILLVCVDVFELKERFVLIAAILLSAVLFSMYHRVTGTEPPLARMIVWGAEGVLWGALFAFRGFGVCVTSHLCVNLFSHAMLALR